MGETMFPPTTPFFALKKLRARSWRSRRARPGSAPRSLLSQEVWECG